MKKREQLVPKALRKTDEQIDRRLGRGKGKYFFLNEKPYRMLWKNERQNLCLAYDFETGGRVEFLLSDVRKHSQRAFTAIQLTTLLRCHPKLPWKYMKAGIVRYPPMIYHINSPDMKFRIWSEDDVIDLYNILVNVHRGAPRKDGRTTTRASLPSRAELMANMRDETMMYIKNKDGEFVPVFKAQI
jgi:hypothetical protein